MSDKPFSFFDRLREEAEKLDAIADEYLQQKERPEKSLEDLWIENTELGYKWFHDAGEDWNAVPEAVAMIADGYTPYGPEHCSSRVSLGVLIGRSLSSIEAHAWRLNDFLNKLVDTPEPPFPTVAKIPEKELAEAIELEEKAHRKEINRKKRLEKKQALTTVEV